MTPGTAVTVEFSHVVAVKILVPALEILIERTHELVDRFGEEPPYASWVRENGDLLLGALAAGIREVAWGTRPLRLVLDADQLGLLAVALGALRRWVTDRGDPQERTALDEARQRLWLTVPLQAELAWWIAPDMARNELLPLLRSLTEQAPLAEKARAERILRRLEERLRAASDADAVRLRTRLDDLAWLAERVRQAVGRQGLWAVLDRLVDPYLQSRVASGATGRGGTATASRASSDGSRTQGERERVRSATNEGSTSVAPGEPASPVRRLAAAVVDVVAFMTGMQIVGGSSSLLFTGEGPGVVVLDPVLYDLAFALVLTAVPLAWWYAYWVYPVGRWGGTLGKRVFSIRVVTATGQVPGQARALGRALVAALVGWLLFLHWWQILWRSDRRGMHDLAADVWVVRGLTDR